MVERNHILAEIRRTASVNGGKPLGVARFQKETGIRKADWYGKLWARWGDAVNEAGFSANGLTGSLDDDFVLLSLTQLIRKLGKYPTAGELRLEAKVTPGFPSHTVFSRIGKKRQLVAKTLEFCKNDGGLQDVVEICQATTLDTEVEHAPSNQFENDCENNFGYVYLLKSGKYFKIGKTDSLERRSYELKIQLPERAERIHSIKTDDPNGIEAYWHSRFASKRKNGEWFDLSTDDVNAFKRRTFM